jgi:hypothetical protein
VKGNSNKHKGSSDSLPDQRLLYFFCLECRTRREAVDEGEAFPVCATCGKRCMERRYDTPFVNEPTRLTISTAPLDTRPENIEDLTLVVTKPKKIRSDRELAVAVLTQLVTDHATALANPDTYHALLHRMFGTFAREVVHVMVIDRLEWRAALEAIRSDASYKEFCLRHPAQLEAFERWAKDPANEAPNFLEPQTNTSHDPLAAREPDTSGPVGARGVP